MVFEITQHKLKKVIGKYLDTFYGDLMENEPRYYYGTIYVKKGNDEGSFAIMDNDSFYIKEDVYNEVVNVFPLEDEELINIIATWYFNKYKKVFNMVYLSTDHNYEVWRIEDDDDNTRWF